MNRNAIGLFSLEGKTAIVTGASRGLGQAMAIGLAEAGADIVALSTDAANLVHTKEAVERSGSRIATVTCDVTREEDIIHAVSAALDSFGHIDILVNNAGTIRRADATEYSDEDWQTVISTNLTSVFRFCRETGRHMMERRQGKIINIASLLSFSGGIHVPAYSAAKGGVAQLTKAFANEWAAYNVQVNAIAPGYFKTDNTEALFNDPVRNKEISGRIPAGEWGDPDDLKGSVIFLASAASDYVNGHILLVDGGWMAR